MAYLPPGADSRNTTPDVNYTAISQGHQCSWFLREVESLRRMDVAWPSYSHGFDALLAAVHREQPMLSYACAPPPRPRCTAARVPSATAAHSATLPHPHRMYGRANANSSSRGVRWRVPRCSLPGAHSELSVQCI